jgi:uncharacterized protein with FMN-binding domain
MHILPAKAAATIVATTIAIVLLFSFKTPPPPIQPIVADVSPSPSLGPSPSASGASPTPTPTGTATGAPKDGQYTGPAVITPFGNVQVRLIISGGKITDVQALALTNDSRRSVAISNFAAPRLHDEVLQAQSAQVNSISGATYTSAAYMQSAQAALDQAHA